jgi:outer membrane murein-binding lipoprotein Lpp
MVREIASPVEILHLPLVFEPAPPIAAAPTPPIAAAPTPPIAAAPTPPITAAPTPPIAAAPTPPIAPAPPEAPPLPVGASELATDSPEHLAETGEPPEDMTLDALVDELLAMLERGSVNPALELAERWRQRPIDDHRMTSAGTARRWALTRDLLGVAVVLPSSILRALAHAIAVNDFDTARSTLGLYRMQNPDNARDLDRHLFKRAKTIYQLVGGVLSRSARAQPDRRPEPAADRRSRIPWTFICVAVVLSTRLVATCDTSTSTPRPHDIQLPPAVVEHLRSQGPPLMQLAQKLEHDPEASREQVAAAVAVVERLQRVADRLGLGLLLRPADSDHPLPRAARHQVGERHQVHARGQPHLRQEHGAELAGPDLTNAHRPPGRRALAKHGRQVHGSSMVGVSDPPGLTPWRQADWKHTLIAEI